MGRWKACILITGAVALAGCAAKVRNVRYNPITAAYEINTFQDTLGRIARKKWVLPRDPSTEAKLDSSTALSLVGKKIKIQEYVLRSKTSLYRQYEAGKRYFRGVDAYEEGRYPEAVNLLRLAKKTDRELEYFSDIDLLLAKCYFGMEDTVQAKSSFDDFGRFSESSCPRSFYLLKEREAIPVADLLAAGYQDTSLDSRHFTRRYPGPSLRPRPFYGHFPATSSFLIAFGFTFDENSDPGLNTLVDISFERGFGVFWGDEIVDDYTTMNFGFSYQLFRDRTNRFGIVPQVETRRITNNRSSDMEVTFWQYAAGLSAGYFIHPRLALFAGGKYNYYNEGNPFRKEQNGWVHYLWTRNKVFGGATLFIFDYIGLSGQYSSLQKAKVGLYLYGGEILFLIK